MRTIAVSDVQVTTAPLRPLSRATTLRDMLAAPVEQLSPSERPLVRCKGIHPLVDAAHAAFYEHRPLALSPDAIWYCLAQGLAQHVAHHAERLRPRLVGFTGHHELIVERPDFELGRDNPWPEVFGSFSDQIAAHVGKLRDLVVADFSTTGPVERAASEVLLMDTFSPYFQYTMTIGCGIPSITLLGTPDDWRSVRRRAAMLSELELSWWTDALLPVLDHLVRAAEGHDDRAFWRSFFRYESTSGSDEVTGWIQVLFPYLRLTEMVEPPEDAPDAEPTSRTIVAPNPHLPSWELAFRNASTRVDRREWLSWDNRQGPAEAQFPCKLASAPVKAFDLRRGTARRLRFVAGLFGVAQDATGALAPDFGWAVVHES